MGRGSNAYRPCGALTKEGISDPVSQAGIDFCTQCCPYDRCIMVERGPNIIHSGKHESALEAQRMAKAGSSTNDIALKMRKNIKTIQRFLKYADNLTQQTKDD